MNRSRRRSNSRPRRLVAWLRANQPESTSRRLSPRESDIEQARRWLNGASEARAAGSLRSSFEQRRRAIALYRRLEAAEPGSFRRELAEELGRLATHLAEYGNHVDAEPLRNEAIELLRQIDRKDPALGRYPLTRAVDDRARSLHETGRYQEAVVADAEAIGLYRSIAPLSHFWYGTKLAEAYDRQAATLAELGRTDDLIRASAELVALGRHWARTEPGSGRAGLVRALQATAARMERVGLTEQRDQALSEVIEVYQSLAHEVASEQWTWTGQGECREYHHLLCAYRDHLVAHDREDDATRVDRLATELKAMAIRRCGSDHYGAGCCFPNPCWVSDLVDEAARQRAG